MSAQVTIYTSISPCALRIAQGEEISAVYQNACINSWKEAGLRVVSLNCESEIATLRDRGIEIEFVSNGTENERSKITNFLSLISERGEPVAGIINADCLLLQHGNFIDAIVREAKNSIILLERLNLNPKTLRPTGEHCFGFDAFFFDTRFVHELESGGSWLIGQTFWDYWFPLMLVYAGAKPKIYAPGLIHLNHDTKWDWKNWGANVSALRNSLLALDNLENRFPIEFVHSVRKKQTKKEFTTALFGWLRAHSEPIKLNQKGTEGEFFERFFAALSESNEPQLESDLRYLKFARWMRYQTLRFTGRAARIRKSIQPYWGPVSDQELHEKFDDVGKGRD